MWSGFCDLRLHLSLSCHNSTRYWRLWKKCEFLFYFTMEKYSFLNGFGGRCLKYFIETWNVDMRNVWSRLKVCESFIIYSFLSVSAILRYLDGQGYSVGSKRWVIAYRMSTKEHYKHWLVYKTRLHLTWFQYTNIITDTNTSDPS